jgi:hypothetical protein
MKSFAYRGRSPEQQLCKALHEKQTELAFITISLGTRYGLGYNAWSAG